MLGLSKKLKVASILFMTISCMEQYNPRPFWNRLADERQIAHFSVTKLTPDGKLPDMGAQAIPVYANESDKYFANLCASCHGPDGKANIPAAKALNPVPRNLTDKAWQKSVSDEHLTKLLVGGGGAVGLSTTMPAWGSVLNEKQIKEMVEKIRSLGK